MIITADDFINDGEIDITAHFTDEKNKRGRLSIRKNDNKYEVYIHHHIDKDEEVLHSGTLQECVDWTNARVGLNDEVR
jgi:hypothetical protein